MDRSTTRGGRRWRRRLQQRWLGALRLAAAPLAVLVADFCSGAARADDLPVRGVVKAVNQASLSTDVPMRVSRLPFREGQRFKAGELLVEFDCRRQVAEVEASRGAVREAELTVASNESLDRQKAIGSFEVDIARARLMRARGELKGLQARADDCVIRAPFNGRVSDVAVRVREFTTAQRPFLAIIEDNNYEIELIVSSQMMTRLAIGQPVAFRLDEVPTAKVEAAVSLVGAVVDPVSKTGKVVAAVRSAPPVMTAGMSGTAVFGVAQR